MYSGYIFDFLPKTGWFAAGYGEKIRGCGVFSRLCGARPARLAKKLGSF